MKDKKTTNTTPISAHLKGVILQMRTLTLKLIASTFHTTEQEYFDILAQYRWGSE